MRKSYVSPEFEFLEIEISDPICTSPVEVPSSTGNWGSGSDTWDDPNKPDGPSF